MRTLHPQLGTIYRKHKDRLRGKVRFDQVGYVSARFGTARSGKVRLGAVSFGWIGCGLISIR